MFPRQSFSLQVSSETQRLNLIFEANVEQLQTWRIKSKITKFHIIFTVLKFLTCCTRGLEVSECVWQGGWFAFK